MIALVLIAHGSRQPEANADLHWVADALKRRAEFEVVEPAFLELAEPDIATAAHRCVTQGASAVILVPYFLSAGIHVRRDLETSRQRLAQAHPGIAFLLADPLGTHELLVDVVASRARAAAQAILPDWREH